MREHAHALGCRQVILADGPDDRAIVGDDLPLDCEQIVPTCHRAWHARTGTQSGDGINTRDTMNSADADVEEAEILEAEVVGNRPARARANCRYLRFAGADRVACRGRRCASQLSIPESMSTDLTALKSAQKRCAGNGESWAGSWAQRKALIMHRINRC